MPWVNNTEHHLNTHAPSSRNAMISFHLESDILHGLISSNSFFNNFAKTSRECYLARIVYIFPPKSPLRDLSKVAFFFEW